MGVAVAVPLGYVSPERSFTAPTVKRARTHSTDGVSGDPGAVQTVQPSSTCATSSLEAHWCPRNTYGGVPANLWLYNSSSRSAALYGTYMPHSSFVTPANPFLYSSSDSFWKIF